MTGTKVWRWWVLLLCVALHLASASAQDSRLQLATPYDAMWVHLYHLQPDSYDAEIAGTVMPISDSLFAQQAAIRLKQVFDGKGLYVHMNLLPQDQDYRDTVTNASYYTPFPEALPQIYLEKSDGQWRYSEESIKTIATLHKEVFPYGTARLVRLFSARGQQKFLGVSAWQILGTGILLLLAFLVNFLLNPIFRWLLSHFGKTGLKEVQGYQQYRSRLAQIISTIVVMWLIKTFIPVLQFAPNFNTAAILIFRVILTVLAGWFFLTLLNLFTAYLNRVVTSTDSRMDDQIIPILRRLLQIVVIIITALHVLRLMDVNITALIAGVSIGGLALALAAQDSVKNLLGSIMIFVDRPFQIGDWVEGGDFSGSVVEVGFRSTRIKTSDTSIISVPNGRMADATVKNMGVREYRLFSTKVGLTYDTPPAMIEQFMAGLKEILVMHPHISNDGWLVNLSNMSASSLEVLVRAYLEVEDYASELQVKESLYLAILRWAEQLGVQFAFPTQTLHVENFPGKETKAPIYDQDALRMQQRWDQFRDQFGNDLKKMYPSSQKQVS
ncbi:MAG: mechanosensitive ion channel family protein [Saprospiraceae bacterium]|nr:mechanosensitive ion channel family protein [Saprospiraceae bacterium]